MRRAVIIVLVAALGGCAGIRHGLGMYQKAADKGVTIGGSGHPGGGTAPPNSVLAEGAGSAPTVPEAKRVKPALLPGGLGGDKEHHAYTGDAPPR